MNDSILAWIVLLPLCGALVSASLYLAGFREREHERIYISIALTAPLLSTVLALKVITGMPGEGSDIHYTLLNWLDIGKLHIDLAFHIDPLGALMLFVVTFIGTVIHIYATGYMRGDKGYGRFFALFNFFLFAMLLLVSADNPIIMFVGWELVGLASYLLISYYHENPENVKAGNKAFIVNRVADLGLVAGIALLFVTIGAEGMDFASLEAHIGSTPGYAISLIALSLFVGAIGKSAQLPLYVWLPDAMAGPTPVSALIHAATMVTAGIYLMARFSSLYEKVPHIGLLIASVGAASALLAALFASFQNDIKKILAYSTMSQLGYMFVAAGLGAYSAAIFHLFTHAFFKALLFMGAGVAILAMRHEQNIFSMGSFGKRAPILKFSMLTAVLAISGIPPLSGFFSKGSILVHAFSEGHYLIWAISLFTAFLTSYYMFRLYFTLFVAESKSDEKPKRTDPTMTATLLILAIGSITAGWLDLPHAYGGEEILSSLLSLPDRETDMADSLEYLLDSADILFAAAGIALAYGKFARRRVKEPEMGIIPKLLYERFYIDSLYEILFVKSLDRLSGFSREVVDARIIDGIVRGGVGIYNYASILFGSLQNGRVGWYAAYMMAGVSAMSLYILRAKGAL